MSREKKIEMYDLILDEYLGYFRQFNVVNNQKLTVL